MSEAKNGLSALLDRVRHGDTIVIAAAYLAAEGRPSTLEIVTLDDRLRQVAVKEGFLLTATT